MGPLKALVRLVAHVRRLDAAVPADLPFTQRGALRPPLAIESAVGPVRVAGVGDRVGVVAADFGFIIPTNVDGFFAEAGYAASVGVRVVQAFT